MEMGTPKQRKKEMGTTLNTYYRENKAGKGQRLRDENFKSRPSEKTALEPTLKADESLSQAPLCGNSVLSRGTASTVAPCTLEKQDFSPGVPNISPSV